MPQHSMQSNAPKPVSAVKLALGSIPKHLKTLDRWILWKYTFIQQKNGKPPKWTKTPHGIAGHKIDATNFANGVTFTEAVQALKARKSHFDGLGFLLGDGIAGIDVDDCIDDDGNLDERGRAISQQYAGTYAEVSPSGRGFKILVDISSDPKLAVIGKNTREIEIYGGRRYFTVTGAKLSGHADVVAPMSQAFAATAAAVGVTPRAPLADMPADTDRKETLGIGLRGIRELFDHLPYAWIENYLDWVKGGMAIHHETGGSAEGLELWTEISRRCGEKFEDGACETKWATFGKPGKDLVTMRTLVREAQSTGWRAPVTIDRAIQDFKPFEEPADAGVVDDDTGAVKPNWWQKHSVGDMLSQPAPAKRWVWQGVLRQGKLMVLGGSGGSSKSYLMLASSVQYALGNDWGPFEMPVGGEPGKVLLLYGEEDREDVHDRVQALKAAFMLTDEQVATVAQRVAVLPLRGSHIELVRQDPQTKDVNVTEQLQRLEARIEEYGVRLVVMDPLAMLHNLEENDNRAVAAFVSGLDAVCMRRNCSIVLVHHFGKGGVMTAREVNEQNLRGASALVAHARTVVVMHRLREDEAASWGVPEADHARWVMWAIAKNNYGPSGRRAWFNVDEHTGAIMPAPTQLQYLNSADIRAAAQAHAQEVMESEITEREAFRAQEAALEAIAHTNRVIWLLRFATQHGRLPRHREAPKMLAGAGVPGSARKAREALEFIKLQRLTDTDGLVNETGLHWLDEHDF